MRVPGMADHLTQRTPEEVLSALTAELETVSVNDVRWQRLSKMIRALEEIVRHRKAGPD